ncbi:unnamed protein product [Lepidochelys kempii]
MNKINCILFTVFIVLIAYCSSGYALKCYICANSPSLCSTNATCTHGDDSCLQIRFADLKTYACWKHSRCNMNEIADDFGADNFDFHCCQKDFCNKSPVTVAGFGDEEDDDDEEVVDSSQQASGETEGTSEASEA